MPSRSTAAAAAADAVFPLAESADCSVPDRIIYTYIAIAEATSIRVRARAKNSRDALHRGTRTLAWPLLFQFSSVCFPNNGASAAMCMVVSITCI